MPRLALSLFVALVLGLSACGQEPPPPPPPAAPAAQKGDTLVVVGSLADTNCFSRDRINIGADHPKPFPKEQAGPGCAAFCARNGFPVALLDGGTPDAPVWVLYTPGAVLADYMGQTVRTQGVVLSKGVLIPLRIELKTEEGWAFIL